MVARVSIPSRFSMSSAMLITCPTPSATITMKCFLPVAEVVRIRSMMSRSKSKGTSGTMMLVAPTAMPTFKAR